MSTAPTMIAPVTAVARRRARLWISLILLGLVLVVAAIGWINHPGKIPSYTGGTEIGASLTIGQSVYVDAGVYAAYIDGDPNDPVPITVVAASPRVIENSAAADVELVLCRHSGDNDDIIGSVTPADLTSFCTALVPIAGARESFPRTAQLLVKITPHQAGSVRVEGIDLTYRDGIRRGTVHTGLIATTTTS